MTADPALPLVPENLKTFWRDHARFMATDAADGCAGTAERECMYPRLPADAVAVTAAGDADHVWLSDLPRRYSTFWNHCLPPMWPRAATAGVHTRTRGMKRASSFVG